MKRCKKCGMIHHDSHIFCGECGTNLENNFVYICNYCGRLYDDGATICPKCHAEPDIQLAPVASSIKEKEMQAATVQKAGELKDKEAVAATVAANTASDLLKTASEKTTEAGQMAAKLAKTASEKAAGKTVETKEKVSNVVQSASDALNSDYSAPSNKKMLIALIVAALVIGGLGSYFLFGRSSGSKETASKMTDGKITTSSTSGSGQPSKPIEKSTSAPGIIKQDTARDAFIGFHTAITNKQLAEAFNILSPDYQKFVRGYDNFARGYATTLRSDVVELNTIQEDNNSAVLTYKLKAEDQVETGKVTQYFIGKAKLLKINGQWRIDSTEAKRASQSSQASSNNFNSTVSDKTFKKTVGTITGNDVNVRKGPGVDYKSLGLFYKGDRVRVVGSNRNALNETWYKIEFDNPTAGLIVGWVRSDFVNIN